MVYKLIEKKEKDGKIHYKTELKVTFEEDNNFQIKMLLVCMDAKETRRSTRFVYYMADGDWLNKRGGAYGKQVE